MKDQHPDERFDLEGSGVEAKCDDAIAIKIVSFGRKMYPAED